MVEALVMTAVILGVVVGAFAPVITWIERKQSAVMQDRIGANRADIGGITILGLLHPLADVIKLLSKEDVVPTGANRVLHLIAPYSRPCRLTPSTLSPRAFACLATAPPMFPTPTISRVRPATGVA